MTAALNDLLVAGCEQLGLALTEAQHRQLIEYTLLLEKWNKTYNLTAVRDAESMLKRHVLDALSVVELVRAQQPKTLADIGTGGGVPGIMLAIMLPDTQVYLVESIGKKCRFLRQAVTELGLQARVSVVQHRVEAWRPETPLSVIICRAFTALDNFIHITRHLGDADSVWLAMKSAHTAEEEKALPPNFCLQSNLTLHVPFETAGRHVLILRCLD